MTAVTVLLRSFVVSAWVSMRQSRPIHEMAEATRRFAEGNFDVRMHNYEGVTEITVAGGDSFNNMADSLQETERQRREFIANVSHGIKDPDDNHRGLYRRYSGRHDPARAGKGVPAHHLG